MTPNSWMPDRVRHDSHKPNTTMTNTASTPQPLTGLQGSAPQPLTGLRVIEFTHMVMGPTCGMVLADMGAEVIKIEPVDGDGTRRRLGGGAGLLPLVNRKSGD